MNGLLRDIILAVTARGVAVSVVVTRHCLDISSVPLTAGILSKSRFFF